MFDSGYNNKTFFCAKWYVFSERVTYFKFSKLRQMYEHRLQNLGINKELNKIHFKDQLLRHFVNAQEQSDGKKLNNGF